MVMNGRDGAERIAEERRRQRGAEGYTEAHDDDHFHGELALAAACYAAPCRIFKMRDVGHGYNFRDPWPWDSEDDKRPLAQDPTIDERVRVLEKAGALIAAEIDRLLREQVRVESATPKVPAP
jgi:hypothetical protein